MSTSKKKVKKISNWGGKREGSGRKPDSGEKRKICVSVHEDNWNTAVKRWKKKPSWLVDSLISRYIITGGSILEPKAAL